MNNKIRHFALALMAVASLGLLSPVGAAETAPVQSLRGKDVAAPEPAPGNFQNQRDRPPIPRDYVQQPPLIPHTIQGYTVTKNFNKCMDCHAWSRYQESKATKVSLTHFKDRDGGELSNISPRRYFCMQCHVPQTDAPPLVDNAFKPASGIR